MNSNDERFNWYKSGVYVAHDPSGAVMLETMQNSAHGARASLLGRLQERWEPLRKMGYTIQEYAPVPLELEPQVVDYKSQRMVIVTADLLFTIGKDETIDTVFDTANMMLIPLQAKEGGNPQFLDYAFHDRVHEYPGKVAEYDYDTGMGDIPVLTEQVKVGDQVAVAETARWHYPAAGEAAPGGVTVQLLTRGGVAVRGVWNDLGDYIAWAPMLKRDKHLEEVFGL